MGTPVIWVGILRERILIRVRQRLVIQFRTITGTPSYIGQAVVRTPSCVGQHCYVNAFLYRQDHFENALHGGSNITATPSYMGRTNTRTLSHRVAVIEENPFLYFGRFVAGIPLIWGKTISGTHSCMGQNLVGTPSYTGQDEYDNALSGVGPLRERLLMWGRTTTRTHFIYGMSIRRTRSYMGQDHYCNVFLPSPTE